MKVSLAIFASLTACSSAFIPQLHSSRRVMSLNNLISSDEDLEAALNRQLEYKPGSADGALAKRFGHLAGKEIKTVGEAYAEFNELLGTPMNTLYRNTMTDIVGTTHLITVNARFQRDGIWSLGLLSSLDLLLKNYPEKSVADKAVQSLLKCVGMDEAEVRAEAKEISDWAAGKTEADVATALKGEGDSPVAKIAKAAKADEFWMYSRYFGFGLIKLMELVGVEQNKDVSYETIEKWVGKDGMDKTAFTATQDSDMWYSVRDKLEMMETLMKEIEIREKKRMAERLEDRAEAAIRKAELESQWAEEVKLAEAAKEKSSEPEATTTE